MFQLKNKLDKAALKARLDAENFERVTLSFYRYVEIEDVRAFRDALFESWNKLGVLGRVYVSGEGINAQINVPEPKMQDFRALLDSTPELEGVFLNIAVEQNDSFIKLSVKMREQIVADGLNADEIDLKNTGNHLSAEEFNAALEEGATCIDMRNFYESRIGHFDGAVCPDVDTFKEQLPMVKEMLEGKEDEKILMYCTGGIRCEKASSYLKKHGFKDVNQLQGGIINYTHQVREQGLDSKFKGANFVFDERMSERITEDVLSECDQCDVKCDEFTNCANKACNLLFIQCGACREKMENTCSEECLAIMHLPEEERLAHYRAQRSIDNAGYKSRIRPALK